MTETQDLFDRYADPDQIPLKRAAMDYLVHVLLNTQAETSHRVSAAIAILAELRDEPFGPF
ncbi:MAG: hypothetical protein M3Q71_14980 [Chloroflexota bacterium]|nr:hypothetical protein [Chloroflexota bacterium]